MDYRNCNENGHTYDTLAYKYSIYCYWDREENRGTETIVLQATQEIGGFQEKQALSKEGWCGFTVYVSISWKLIQRHLQYRWYNSTFQTPYYFFLFTVLSYIMDDKFYAYTYGHETDPSVVIFSKHPPIFCATYYDLLYTLTFIVWSPRFWDECINVKSSESNVLCAEQKFSMYENMYIYECHNYSSTFFGMKEDQF